MSAVALDPVRHERLLKDIDHIQTIANIPLDYLRHSMVGRAPQDAVDWVRNFHQNRVAQAGLVLHGRTDAEGQCLAICGALVRNFVDARVLPLNSVLELSPDDILSPTVMIIPNFHQRSYGKTLPAWKVSSLYDALLSRFTANKPTVVAVEDFESLESSYGATVTDHLKNHYRVLY